jgi:hypothetical protein
MDTKAHPSAARLEAFAEGTLVGTAGEAVRRHLVVCAPCQQDVEEWRSLFAALRALPVFTPSPGFAARVLEKVRVPQPWHVRATALLERLLPRTTGAWALAVALLAVPALAGAGLLTWLLSKSYVTTHGLWVFATDRFAAAGRSVVERGVDLLLQTDAAAWLAQSVGTLVELAGVRGLGAVAVTLSVTTLIAAWVLYKNLIRSWTRGTTHVSYGA